MKSFFFNAEPTADIEHHPTGYDREYDSDDLAAFFEPFFDSGVFAGEDTEACKVVVQEGNTLRVNAGAVIAKGRGVRFDGTETITVTQDARVVARMNKTADVRGFQLLAVQELVQTEDIYDVELAQVVIVPVVGGYEARVTDTRTFTAFTGQPPYYPPDEDHLPYMLWLYTLGYPMTAAQKAAVEGNPSLMAVFNASLGAARSNTVTFTAADWGSASGGVYTMILARARHGRQTDRFGYTVRHTVGGVKRTDTWGAKGVNVMYRASDGAIQMTSYDAFGGEVVFYG